MAIAIALAIILVLVFSLAFNYYSPWWFTPLSSNWSQMDSTIVLTLWISGIVFTAVTLFTAYAVVRYRYRPDRRAAYEPENKKLELWLTGVTSVGILAMLVPGLFVWNDYVNVPKDAMTVEAVGQQWQWSFRLPGNDGVLGKVDTKLISAGNVFGLQTGNELGQDDVLVSGSELHLPLNKPVRMLLRSKDVLHDFYVPHFRAKMDVVPGSITRLWFTPTKTGKFEIVCAEYCGLGHHTMRGTVVVEEESAFKSWLASQSTLAQVVAKNEKSSANPLVAKGQRLAEEKGCVGCHTIDGAPALGPTWKDLYGKTETLTDGQKVVVDDAYLKESIVKPEAKIVQGYSPAMPPYELSAEEMDAIIAYTKQLAGQGGADSFPAGGDALSKGQALAQEKGCTSCHSIDGSQSVGPTWKGLFGSNRKLTDGRSIVADDTYFKESISNPSAAVVEGYSPVMPPFDLPAEEADAITVYAKSLSESTSTQVASPPATTESVSASQTEPPAPAAGLPAEAVPSESGAIQLNQAPASTSAPVSSLPPLPAQQAVQSPVSHEVINLSAAAASATGVAPSSGTEVKQIAPQEPEEKASDGSDSTGHTVIKLQ